MSGSVLAWNRYDFCSQFAGNTYVKFCMRGFVKCNDQESMKCKSFC